MKGIIKLNEVANSLENALSQLTDELEPIYLEVEEKAGVVVDYTIMLDGNGYLVTFDDRDLTPGLETVSFNSKDELIGYFAEGQRKGLTLDAVND